MRKVFAFGFLLLLFISSCRPKPKIVASLKVTQFQRTVLRKSGYAVNHPVSMQLDIDEFYHPWQDSSFWISKPDSLPPYSNTFAIRLGFPDSAKAMGWDLPIIEQVQSVVMGAIIKWDVRKSDTGYFVADARLRDIKFLATSVTRTGIDSMIACISTFSPR
jgi:hypothetical protein